MSKVNQDLDHLVLFVPVDPTTNLPLVPTFFTDNFTLSPGGFHADGATSNTLILLSDGCYIELISFINPDAAPTHWWGPDASFVGWKDWCLTNSTTPESNYEGLKDSHGEPIHGGRKRADGVDVKWAVKFPKGDNGGQHVRGRIPFFCHDITPRNIRVPLDDKKTKHACGALGVRQLTVITKNKIILNETRRIYTSIFGSDGITKGDEVIFSAGRVNQVRGIDGGSRITLRLPQTKEEFMQVEESGFMYGNVVLGAENQPGKTLGTAERLDKTHGDGSVGGLWVEYV
ncbi:glyoxalase-like domain-containing protein [Pyrenochaeta sp. MPI-SDFR-AT-0127]|nr:glyoxalase-like domain-containing protein [Pyrenochaeta sp. MPI-SDFR-AT-0127]